MHHIEAYLTFQKLMHSVTIRQISTLRSEIRSTINQKDKIVVSDMIMFLFIDLQTKKKVGDEENHLRQMNPRLQFSFKQTANFINERNYRSLLSYLITPPFILPIQHMGRIINIRVDNCCQLHIKILRASLI